MTPWTKLEQGGTLLLDGGMGQELVARGVDNSTGLWSAEALIHQPELVQQAHKAFLDAGAEVIATECPTCHTGLEMHQVRAEKEFGIETNVRIVYFTQLLGLAVGLSPRKLGIHENISESMDLLKNKGVA